MKTLTYIRHGESVSNAGGLTMAHEAVPLSELGHTQARALAQALGVQPSRVLVSRLVRTHQTAQPFCERFGVLPEQDARLDEFSVIDPALIAGLTGAERKPFVKAYWDDPDPSKRLGRYADTFAEFDDRVDQFMRHMNNLPDATVIFGHGIWFWAVAMAPAGVQRQRCNWHARFSSIPVGVAHAELCNFFVDT